MKAIQIISTALVALGLSSCGKDPIVIAPGDTTTLPPVVVPFDINQITDTYPGIASPSMTAKWTVYNVHDPAIIKSGEYFYSYSTDVAYGNPIRPGLQVRKSKNLVEWQFVGWVFPSLPAMGAQFIQSNGGTPFDALWAPHVVKVGNEFRLYYSLSSLTPRLSVIGLATATNPEGPWAEKGLTVTSTAGSSTQTNAIDPSVIIAQNGEHWMYYGSAWDGIYALKLNPTTGLAMTNGDKGTRIANRGFTGGRYNGNIEAPEIIYNSTLNKYFLFISYDWLETKYNVRVMRSDNPNGPFLNYAGQDANTNQDHGPMILAPYQFMGHGGWQGTAHCGVFKDDAGQYFMAHQGRPSVSPFFMDLHVRKIFWTENGWPVVSPERYAGEDNSTVPQSDIVGDWEQIILGYRVVPGYATEQTNPDLQVATTLTLSANGTINGSAANTWAYMAPWLTLSYSNGFTDKVFVQKGRDWENKKAASFVFTGLNNVGTAIWGKKK